MLIQFSNRADVNKALENILYGIAENPYDSRRVKRGTETIRGVIAIVRRQHGRAAARSIKITIH